MIPLAQRIRQARAHGMRSGATEALRQLGVRLAALTTDEERRKVGLTHRQFAWIDSRVRMEHDETAHRRRHFRLAIAIPGSKTFMPRIPSLGCRYLLLCSNPHPHSKRTLLKSSRFRKLQILAKTLPWFCYTHFWRPQGVPLGFLKKWPQSGRVPPVVSKMCVAKPRGGFLSAGSSNPPPLAKGPGNACVC